MKENGKRTLVASKQVDERLIWLFSELQDQISSLDEGQKPVPSVKKDGEKAPAAGPASRKVEDAVCPLLKTSWDQTTRYGYPNEENHCYKLKKGVPVSLTDQERTCLTGQFRDCVTFSKVDAPEKKPGLLGRLFKRG